MLGKHFTVELYVQLPVSTNTNSSMCHQATREVTQHAGWQPCDTTVCARSTELIHLLPVLMCLLLNEGTQIVPGWACESQRMGGLLGAAPVPPALGRVYMVGGVSAHSLLRTRPRPDTHSILQVTLETALSCLLAWCTRSRMVFTARGVSKSLASAAFTASLVLASLEWDMGVTYDDEASKTLSISLPPSPPCLSLAWHQP